MIMLNDFCVKHIQHSNMNTGNVDRIVRLKQQYWPYSYEMQKKWIEENLNSSDSHLCIETASSELVGYLNLVKVNIILDGVNTSAIGIGNVCVDKLYLKKGIGLLLINVANYFLKNIALNGVLLCKEKEIDFYSKAGWSLLNRESTEIIVKEKPYSNNLMYTKNDFSQVHTLKIDRNF